MSGVLKVKVNGEWVKVVGSGMSADVARWNSAWGVAKMGSYPPGIDGVGWTAGAHITDPLVFTTVAGRRYRVTCIAAAMQAVSANHWVFVSLETDSVLGGSDRHGQVITGVNWTQLAASWLVTGDGLAHTYKVKIDGSFGAGGIVGYMGEFYIEDVGPVSFAANPPTAPPSAWQALPLLNGWSNRGGGQWDCQVRKIGDIVYVRGQAHTAAGTSPYTQITTLPVGFRPPLAVNWPTTYYNGGPLVAGLIQVMTDGALLLSLGVAPNPASDGAIAGSFSITP